jgi:hypothetical protein
VFEERIKKPMELYMHANMGEKFFYVISSNYRPLPHRYIFYSEIKRKHVEISKFK